MSGPDSTRDVKLTVEVKTSQAIAGGAGDPVSSDAAAAMERSRLAQETWAHLQSRAAYHDEMGRAQTLASLASGNITGAIMGAAGRAIMAPARQQNMEAQHREHMIAAGATDDELDIWGAFGIGGGSRGGGGTWAMRGRMAGRAVGAAALYAGYKGVKMALSDDKEVAASQYAEQVSMGNIGGIFGSGAGRFGDDQHRSADNFTHVGIVRKLGQAKYGAMEIADQMEFMRSFGDAYGGRGEVHAGMFDEAARARMAGVGGGTSGAYYGQFAGGGGGVGGDRSSIERLTGTLQALGLSGQRLEQAIQSIAQNTQTMVSQGIKTDVPALQEFLNGIGRTSGLENMGARAGAYAGALQQSGASALQRMTGWASSLGEISVIANAANGANDYQSFIANIAKQSRDPGGIHSGIRSNFGEEMLSYYATANGVPPEEAMKLARTGSLRGASQMVTARDRGIAEGYVDGPDWSEGKSVIATRKNEKVDLVLSPEASRAAENLNAIGDALVDALRNIGGGALHYLVPTASQDALHGGVVSPRAGAR